MGISFTIYSTGSENILKMIKWLKLSFVAFFIFSIVPIISQASAHSMFNSAEEFMGGYRVQIATLPEFPQIGEKSQLLLRITDGDFTEVDRFTMGMRVFYNEQQILAFTPSSYEGAHWENDFVFETPGIHIVKVDLYDSVNNTLTMLALGIWMVFVIDI